MKSITGVVIKGKQRGRALGYPTINIPFFDVSVDGIYAARVYLEDEDPYQAAAFANPTRGILEAHLLDFNDDLYGETATIELLEKIRETAAHTDDAALREEIARDIAKAREYFKN